MTPPNRGTKQLQANCLVPLLDCLVLITSIPFVENMFTG